MGFHCGFECNIVVMAIDAQLSTPAHKLNVFSKYTSKYMALTEQKL